MFRFPFGLLIGLGLLVSDQETRKIALRTLCFFHMDHVQKVFVAGSEPGDSTEVTLFAETFSRQVEVVAIDGTTTIRASARTLTQTQPVAVLSVAEAIERMRTGGADAFALSRDTLQPIVAGNLLVAATDDATLVAFAGAA